VAINFKNLKMKKIKAMVESAPTKKDAKFILDAMRLVGDITEAQYAKGRELIVKEFSN
jgi:hypothetical protein